MLDIEYVRGEIEAGAPGLDLSSLRFFAEGWDYELWETDGGLLFRLPKREECVAPLAAEARLLTALSGRLPLAVPEPVHVRDGWFSYRKLAGEPLSSADLDGVAAADAIAGFLTALHALPIDVAREAGVTVHTGATWRDEYLTLRASCDRLVSPLLDAAEREAVTSFWNAFLGDERHFAFRPSLMHHDLGLEHILADASGMPRAVIDFADAAVGDPAIDFAGLPPGPLRERALDAYRGPRDETFAARAEAYRQIGPFHEVLYGIEIDEPAFVRSGLEGVRERVVRKKHN